jgi:hypothetical protein
MWPVGPDRAEHDFRSRTKQAPAAVERALSELVRSGSGR